MNLQFFIGPIVGGLIGYITNGIAIKMLFRPLNPIYIFGKKVPFTPGIIPKERDRIAHSIGQVVGKELINQETLRENLLSQEMYVKIERSINEWFIAKKQSKETVREVLCGLASEKTVDTVSAALKNKVSGVAYEKIVDLELGGVLAESACHEIKGNLGALAMFLNDALIDTAKLKLEQIINDMIKEKAGDIIGEVVEKEGEQLLDRQIQEIANQFEDELPKIKYILLKQYQIIIEKQLQTMLDSIDIPHIVEEKIKAFDMLELEKLIFEIMGKELRAIIWLGALLGMIMGIVMSIF
ncbi:MAG: DUF445 family protein [Cellulosilyticaceae bacterium]